MRQASPHFALLVLASFSISLGKAGEGEDFFEKKIRPLFEKHCLECHSASQKIKGGLRLDFQEGWKTGGDAGAAVVPGDTDSSLLLKAVRYGDVDLQMPPRRKLSDSDVAALEQWVRMGAPDTRTEDPSRKNSTSASKALPLEAAQTFWAYRPAENQMLPPLQNAPWAEGRVDAFLLAAMEKAGITPSPDAPAHAVLRRLYFVLTGLAPEEERMDAFARDYRRNPSAAVTAETDRLLATEAFAEHFGRRWLDLTRFAESSGGGRTLLFKDAWRFRDYVLGSLHADRPLNQFIMEHVAGDLMPSDSDAEKARRLVATGFLILGPNNYEEQDKQQLRFDIIDEQIDTIGKAFLGQTLGCARCHDHKFDPIPQRDYYALAGIFASTRSLHNLTDNVARWVSVPLPGYPEEERRAEAHKQKIAAIKKEIELTRNRLAQFTPTSPDEKTVIRNNPDRPSKSMPVDPGKLAGVVLDDSDARLVGDWKKSSFLGNYVGTHYLSDQNTAKGEKSATFTPALPQSGRYEVRFAYSPGGNRSRAVHVTILHADGEETLTVDETKTPPFDGLFTSLGTYRFEKEGAGYVLVSNAGDSGFVIVDAIQFLPEAATTDGAPPPARDGTPTARSATEPPNGSPRKNAAPEKHREPDKAAEMSLQKQLTELSNQLKELEKSAPPRPMAMGVTDDSQVGDTEIRVRGVAKQKGARVPRGFLRAVHVPESEHAHLNSEQSGRLELAHWLVSDQNPLTSRVLVNHVWAWIFGRGLVPTTENFGTTGEPPTHPELLDDLATRFVAQGWSLKKLVRELVTSHAWRLGEAPLDTRDPRNALWSRYQPRRLDSDQMRDALLQAAGRLDLRFAGPNILGAGEINADNSSAQNVEYKYVFTDVRRSVYTPAFRNKRHEIFETFDFGDINNPVGVRETSTVAPQALFFLNSQFVSELALATGAAHAGSNEPVEKSIQRMVKKILGREPTPAEVDALYALHGKAPADEDPSKKMARIAHALFASIDFRYLR
jgi:hypothetical protein